MRALAIMVALAAAGCAPGLELGDPTVQAVCLNQAQLQFAGGADQAIVELGPVDLAAPEGRRVTLSSASMTADTGVGDLGFASHVHVALLDTDQSAVTLVDAAVSDGVVSVDGDPNVDVAAELRAGADRIEVTMTGDMPADQWTAVVDLCFDVE